jgi:transposase-like protein
MDLIDRIRNDIDSRLEELRPQIEEIPRLEAVLAALDAVGGDGQSERVATRTPRGGGRTRGRGAAAATTRSRTSRPRRRARRGQRREEFLQLVKGSPEITIAEAARQIGVSPPQISTLVRRLEEEGVIHRSDGRFVLVAPAASEATSDEVAVVEGDAGSPEADTEGPGVEQLATDAEPGVAELPPETGTPVAELPPEGESTGDELAPEAGAREEELGPDAARDEAGRPQAT